MKCGVIRSLLSRFAAAGLMLLIPIAQASTTPPLSGSFQVVKKSQIGGQIQVRLRVHLVNRGPLAVNLQRLTLWDFSHPARGATQNCAMTLQAGGSANVTRDFAIPRQEYELWKRGTRPRLVLQVASGTGRVSTQVVRLDRLPGRKVN